jgi:hypothetical protein
VISDEKEQLEIWHGRYELTGKVIEFVLAKEPNAPGGGVFHMTVVTLEDKQLVVKGNLVTTDEVKLEKQ